jgi:hypothetical protein
MVHRITLKSNPRLLFVYLFIPCALAVGGLAFWMGGGLWGILVLAGGGLIAWTLLKFTRRQLATRIEAGEEGLSISLYGEERFTYPWASLRVAGIAEEAGKGKRGRKLFIYREEGDKLFTIPDEFENFETLVAEVRGRTDFREIRLEKTDTLKDRLREILG